MNINQRSPRNIWPQETVNQAKKLRIDGLSYKEISDKLGVAKSTLFSWISEIKNPGFLTKEDQLLHLEKIRKLAAKVNRSKKESRIKEIDRIVKKEVSSYVLFNNQEYLKSLLSMLYWAEGTKTGGAVIFANTDPNLALLFITLLRKCFPIDESKFRIRLHLHYYHKNASIRKYWASILKVPESQFGKIHLKRRSKNKKFRKNFAGICFIVYHSQSLKLEIMSRAYEISNKLAPVAQWTE